MRNVAMTLRGALTLALIALSTLFWAAPLLSLALLKLVPLRRLRTVVSRWLMRLAQGWVGTNGAILAATRDIRWDVRGIERLERREWYLIICNHRSWVDILVLQKVFHRRIPFLKFFIKRELIWVPVLGLAWWALDMPFMKRYSRAYLQQHPEKQGQDLATTRRACEHFARTPTAVVNFVEATRYSDDKRDAQGRPYRHLLKPRAGGIAFVLSAMGASLHALLDVTLVYPGGQPTFWDLCNGRMDEVVVDVRVHPLPDWARSGDVEADLGFRRRVQVWINALWREKDDRIEGILEARRG